MEAIFGLLASRLRRADDFVAIAGAVITELELAGYRGVAVLAHGADGSPSVWAGNAFVERERALAYLMTEHGGDRALAEVRRTHAPATLSARAWVIPILGCGELIGTIRVEATNERDDLERRAELSLIGSLVSVRLALLGMEAPLARHVRTTLTDRQHEVAYLVARGCTNAEIGNMLAISANAVKKHVSRVLEVMGVSNRTELAAFAGRWASDRQAPRSIVLVELPNPVTSKGTPRSTRAA